MEIGITRVLMAYEREPGEDLVAEWPLEGVDAGELRRLFGAADDDPMYDCWPVGPAQREQVSAAAGHEIDLGRFDYFVEAYRLGDEGDPRCPPRDLPAFPDARNARPRTPVEPDRD